MTTPPPSSAFATTAGHVQLRPLAPSTDPLAGRDRAIWTAGDFGHIARGYADGAADFIARLGLQPGTRVLDIACGTGNLAIPAARAGADVTGIDIAPNLLEEARAWAAGEGLAVRFEEGNAEAMPYADASFDVAVSMFGIMFASRPERAAAELLRVVRPGGRIALASWTPGGFIGRMLREHVKRVPPPPGLPSTLGWGDPEIVAARLGDRVTGLTTAVRRIAFTWPVPPAGVVALFERWYGPTVRTFAALDEPGRADLRTALERLWSEHNEAPDGTTRVESEYLEVQAVAG